MASSLRRGPATLAALAATLAFAAPAHAITFGAPFRISQIGAEGDVSRSAAQVGAAWGGSSGGRYLVAYKADGLAADNDYEIFARLIDGTGTAVTADVRLSTTGVEGATTQQSAFPAVVYSPVSQDFFVAWDQEVTVAGRREIFVARVPSSGAAPGAPLQVSAEDAFTGTAPGIAVDRTSGAMLVVWGEDNRTGTTKWEVYGQRLDSTGAEVGSDVRVSDKHSGSFIGRGVYPEAAWNQELARWLVVWQYNGSGAHFQLLDGAGAPVGADDPQIVPVPDGGEPTVAAAGSAGWQVAYRGTAAVVTRRIDATGAVGAPGPTLGDGLGTPAIGSDPQTGSFLVATGYSGFATLELAADGSAVGIVGGTGLGGAPAVAFDESLRRWFVAGTSTAPGGDSEAYGVFSGPAVTPPPAPVPAPPPAAVTPPPAAAKPPAFSQVASLPSVKKCVSRRNFRIRVKEPAGVDITRVTVSVNGRQVKVVKSVRRSAVVDLRGLPKGRFTVKIALRTADGKTITGSRRYRTCVPKKQ